MRRDTAAAIGEIEGADLLVKGSVTEFEPGSAGAGGGIGMGGGSWAGAAAAAIFSGFRQSHVAMIIQVIDAKTSRLLFSATVEGKANDFNIGGALAGFGGHFIGAAGLGTFQKTPVEKAIRVAILQALNELASKTPQTYFRHGTASGVVNPTSGPALQKPTAFNSSGTEKARDVIKVNSPVGKGPSSILPATVTVKVASANLRESAGTQGKVVATLTARTKLSVQAEDNGWYFVQTDDQKTGWIAKSLTAN